MISIIGNRKLLIKQRFILLMIALSFIPLLLIGCTTTQHSTASLIQQAERVDSVFKNLYFLEFDHEGLFTNSKEAARAIREIKHNSQLKNIVILSLGWNHIRDDSPQSYQHLLIEYFLFVHKHYPKSLESINETAFFAVSWESSLTGVSDAFADIIPTEMAKGIGTVISIPFQPLTVWSKASTADKIGRLGLKDVMTKIMDEITKPKKDYPIFMIGHSFGSRILTALSLPTISFKRDQPSIAEEEKLLKSIKGMVLIQPALSSLDIHAINDDYSRNSKNNFPIYITESRHDHLNRLAFPLVNIPLNLYSSRQIGHYLKTFFDDIHNDSIRTSYKLIGGLEADLINLAYSPIYFTASYLRGQYEELKERNWAYIPDTLAQLPLIEIPVEAINQLTSSQKLPDEIWGNRHKGLFSFGPLMESAATYQSVPKEQQSKPVYKLAEIFAMQKKPEGIIPIDASKEIHYGLFVDLENPLYDYTVGWLDPLGSHIDYENDDIYNLIYCVADPKEKCKPQL